MTNGISFPMSLHILKGEADVKAKGISSDELSGYIKT